MPCGASLTVPVPLLPRKVAAGVAAPGAIGGPPGEPAGAVAKRWSALDQMPMKLTSTRPLMWTTMDPGVGMATAPGTGMACRSLLLLAPAGGNFAGGSAA